MSNTTPTSTGQVYNAGELITRAYRMMGQLPSGGVPTADEISQGLMALNLMLQGWEMDGINLWRQKFIPVDVEAGQGHPNNPIIVNPPITELENAQLVVSRPPNPYSRALGVVAFAIYAMYPQKEQQALSPAIISWNRERDASYFFLSPVPSVACQIILLADRPFLNATQPSDIVDVPAFAQEAVAYNLAVRLMNDQGLMLSDPQTGQYITQQAALWYTKLKDFDRPTSIMMAPYGRMNRNGFFRGP